jgi:hypothetical protein
MNNKKKGMNWEKKVAQTLASGALWFDKGDLKTKDHIIECKFTEKSGYRITIKLLDKLWRDSLEANKLPALIIGIKDNKGTVPILWTIKAQIEREAK